jgi:capsid protein
VQIPGASSAPQQGSQVGDEQSHERIHALKAEQIERAALGPSDPSGADRAVAAKARSLVNQARVELANDTVNAGTRKESAIIGLGGAA